MSRPRLAAFRPRSRTYPYPASQTYSLFPKLLSLCLPITTTVLTFNTRGNSAFFWILKKQYQTACILCVCVCVCVCVWLLSFNVFVRFPLLHLPAVWSFSLLKFIPQQMYTTGHPSSLDPLFLKFLFTDLRETWFVVPPIHALTGWFLFVLGVGSHCNLGISGQSPNQLSSRPGLLDTLSVISTWGCPKSWRYRLYV